MTSTGDTAAGAGATVVRGGSTAWTTPGNITTSNNAWATATVPSDYLVSSTYGFSIPAAATITGVTVKVEASETGTGTSNYVIQLSSNTTPTLIGSSKNSATVNGTTDAVQTFGSATDLWGATLTPSTVNSSGFGATLWSTDTVNVLRIDLITIAIDYTLGTQHMMTRAGGIIGV